MHPWHEDSLRRQDRLLPRDYAGRMLTIGSTVLGVNDIARATAFWNAALGYVPRVVLADPDGNRFCVVDKSPR